MENIAARDEGLQPVQPAGDSKEKSLPRPNCSSLAASCLNVAVSACDMMRAVDVSAKFGKYLLVANAAAVIR